MSWLSKQILLLTLSGMVNFLGAQKLPQFTVLPPEKTNIAFKNTLIESPSINIIAYEYFYNGGGVAAGDFNNDGLIDLYFTSNQQPNKLYINKGNWQFEDATKSAGVPGRRGWKTGVTVADVNGDGLLDIYVCYSGNLDRAYRANQLFINNGVNASGNVTFTDKAKEMGVADEGYTTNAAFFDFDRDGDLDLYVLNHNIKSLRNFDAAFVKKMVDEDAGDRLYENVNGKFTDISRKAGIISNPLGYGLGLNIADINNDGWADIYVSNDYVEEDYMYINNKNGTFTESLKSSLGHISNFSMGIDIADINNDGLLDIYTLDMLPEDNKRQKLLYAPDNYELYNNQVEHGFYHQLMRNMLQLNNGNGTFSEIGQLAGISNTDWSWAALFADFNNDGQKDLFVTNGYGRDMINRDFVKFYANERLKFSQGKTEDRMFSMLQGIPSTPTHNYIYENNGNLTFKNRSFDWGFEEENYSHGAVYADLDNDGDLDLVVNRMNQPAGIYRNNTIENTVPRTPNGEGGHFLKLKLKTNSANTLALGARVTVHTASGAFTLENYPVHGFQSAMQIPLHFTFKDKIIDSITVRWQSGDVQILKTDLKIDSELTLTQDSKNTQKPIEKPTIKTIFQTTENQVNFTHKEGVFNDFKTQPLMLNMISYSGPRIAKADINGDKLDDIYICGAKNQSGAIYLQQPNGSFSLSEQPHFMLDAASEDCGAVFFDADKDGDLDLYVISGGYAVDENDASLQDRLYINNDGKFIKNSNALPLKTLSESQVVPMDFDNDGDLDLFLAGRVIPSRYPESPESYLLVNDGKGIFTDQTATIAPIFSSLGILTDAIWADINGDKNNELIVCGEWSSPQCLAFKNGQFTNISEQIFDKKLNGLWNRLHLADTDNDGDLDLIAGNWGTNSQLKASETEPATLHFGDFDKNGFIDPLLCYYVQGKSYPMASRDEMTDQIVSLRQRFTNYESYSKATINDILTEEQLKSAKTLSINHLSTTYFENVNGKFITRTLPIEADYAPVYGIATDDFDHDGKMDILLCGNVDQVRIKIGKMDANYGILLKGSGKGGFQYTPQYQSGLNIKGCVRDVVSLKTKNGATVLMLGVNNQSPIFLKF